MVAGFCAAQSLVLSGGARDAETSSAIADDCRAWGANAAKSTVAPTIMRRILMTHLMRDNALC
jgi:hypothetical protein